MYKQNIRSVRIKGIDNLEEVTSADWISNMLFQRLGVFSHHSLNCLSLVILNRNKTNTQTNCLEIQWEIVLTNEWHFNIRSYSNGTFSLYSTNSPETCLLLLSVCGLRRWWNWYSKTNYNAILTNINSWKLFVLHLFHFLQELYASFDCI